MGDAESQDEGAEEHVLVLQPDDAATPHSAPKEHGVGFVRIAACATQCCLADPLENANAVMRVASTCSEQSVALAAFPELGLTGYSIDDLFYQDVVLDAVEQGIGRIIEASRELMPVIVVGAPLRYKGRLYNTAVILHRGRMLGVVPKIHLPNYREFYERRYFASGVGMEGSTIGFGDHIAPFGPDLLFVAEDRPGFVFHVEICEDMWIPVQPSAAAALAGATTLVNLSASNITVGKADTRRMLCQAQSARCRAAYIYTAAGMGESTTDLAWDGQTSIFENGTLLAETPRFEAGNRMAMADINLSLLQQEREQQRLFEQNRMRHATAVSKFRHISFRLG
ncbi:nitrilase-related carbon-nitrogen hydrolase [Roseomonas chloroacetimidivorans]|uniref:nitrilase-related carbon-nitrogen hydrolase n=1 Tax=Roseomonas chloroacetimidivorans TaxID=1766656 RepID=UPI003C784305